MRQYPDAATYRLVAASSEVLGLPPEQVLESFGRYWIIYTAREGYGELLKLSGRSIWEFLANLDNLHARVGLSFAKLRPPSFSCSDQTPTSVKLHYRSTRQGLTHLVIGLLIGLGEMFETPVTVELLQRPAPDPGDRPDAAAYEDVFLIRLAGAGA